MEASTASSSGPANTSDQLYVDQQPPEWFQTYAEFQGILVTVLHSGAIICNGFTLLTMACARCLHTPSNMVLASLALADALVAVQMTIDKYVNGDTQRSYHWVAGTVVNTALPQFPLLVAQMHTVVIAAERYIAVTRPLRYASIWTAGRVAGVLGATWGLSALLCSTTIAWGAIWESPSKNRMPTVHSLLTAIVAYVVEGILVSVLYARILAVARKQRRKIQEQQTQIRADRPVGDPHPGSGWSRGSRFFAAIVAAIFLCWGPFFAVTVAIDVTEHVPLWHYALQNMLLCLGFAHYLFNLGIYIWKSKDFRKAYRLMLLCRFRELRQ